MLESLTPLGDKLLVRLLETKPDRVIWLPKSKRGNLGIECEADQPVNYGEVLKAGPGKKDKRGHRVPMFVKAGDVVAFGSFIDFLEDNLAMISQMDVLVRVDEKPNA